MAFSGESYFPIFPPLPETKICIIYTSQIRKLWVTLLRSKVKKIIHTFRLWGGRNYESPKNACSSSPSYIDGRGTFALKRGQKWNSPNLVLFHKCFSAQRWRISSLLPKCTRRITWCDMLCMTALKAGLPVAPRQLFSFIAVAASEIVTVLSSNSLLISFWRSFRGIFWEVLWTLKLTQSQVGIVGFSKNC